MAYGVGRGRGYGVDVEGYNVDGKDIRTGSRRGIAFKKGSLDT